MTSAGVSLIHSKQSAVLVHRLAHLPAEVGRCNIFRLCRRVNRRSSYVAPFPYRAGKIGLRLEATLPPPAYGRVSAEAAENRTFGGHGAGRKPAKPRLCAKSRHQGGKKWGAARAPPKQCADNDNFQNMGDVVPCSFILPSENPPLFAPKGQFSISH